MPNAPKKIILLSGATDGIGLATAEKLIALGHHVLIHGRNAEKLKATEEKLRGLDSGIVESYRADLSALCEVEGLAKAIKEKHTRLDVIINNAGIYKTNTPITEDKLDVRFAVNTLAPYLLSRRLLPLMSNKGRIINLSSAAQAPVELDAMEGKHHLHDQFKAYAQSKLAITMWSRQLALQLGKQGPAIIAVNPGSLLASKMVKEGFGIAGKDINIGADILIRTSISEEFTQASGLYFDNDIGELAAPHPDGLNTKKCIALLTSMDKLLKL
ncbi:Short-chain dehydrogenase [Alteromonadaceae bacterium Bs31]|nr:Short-chain dehydrogenase [Alteromonadaceae bacterium Bs31]